MWVSFGGSWHGKYWYILWPFGIFYGLWYILWPFDIFAVIWYIFLHFSILHQEKSGNPATGHFLPLQ
jgi:uncharacterized membrane protein